VSLENWELFILLTPLVIIKPGMVHVLISYSSILYRDFSMRTYNIGESGHPCHNPILAWKKRVVLPFTRGVIQGLVIQSPI
jgi:hypothetical protein